jgi:hypothetical protein
MVCLRNICINTLHKGDSDDDDNNNNNKNSDNKICKPCSKYSLRERRRCEAEWAKECC